MTEAAIQEASAPDSLVARAATGDEAAFARLVSEHHTSMARVAYAITGNADSAADAVQAAWAIAWRRLGGLRDHGSVRAWLVAIAANEARQAVRRSSRPVIDISTVVAGAGGGDPGEDIPIIDLARALRSLKPDDRALLGMRFGAGLDSTAIAAQLGMSASGVRSRLDRLLDRLRLELDHG